MGKKRWTKVFTLFTILPPILLEDFLNFTFWCVTYRRCVSYRTEWNTVVKWVNGKRFGNCRGVLSPFQHIIQVFKDSDYEPNTSHTRYQARLFSRRKYIYMRSGTGYLIPNSLVTESEVLSLMTSKPTSRQWSSWTSYMNLSPSQPISIRHILILSFRLKAYEKAVFLNASHRSHPARYYFTYGNIQTSLPSWLLRHKWRLYRVNV
jgi:hypothetical protein